MLHRQPAPLDRQPGEQAAPFGLDGEQHVAPRAEARDAELVAPRGRQGQQVGRVVAGQHGRAAAAVARVRPRTQAERGLEQAAQLAARLHRTVVCRQGTARRDPRRRRCGRRGDERLARVRSEAEVGGIARRLGRRRRGRYGARELEQVRGCDGRARGPAGGAGFELPAPGSRLPQPYARGKGPPFIAGFHRDQTLDRTWTTGGIGRSRRRRRCEASRTARRTSTFLSFPNRSYRRHATGPGAPSPVWRTSQRPVAYGDAAAPAAIGDARLHRRCARPLPGKADGAAAGRQGDAGAMQAERFAGPDCDASGRDARRATGTPPPRSSSASCCAAAPSPGRAAVRGRACRCAGAGRRARGRSGSPCRAA